MSIELWLMVGAFVLQSLAVIITGVRAVDSIRTTTATLDISIKHLSGAVNSLEDTVSGIRERQSDQATELAVMSSRVAHIERDSK